jgi:hypothetical protein
MAQSTDESRLDQLGDEGCRLRRAIAFDGQ